MNKTVRVAKIFGIDIQLHYSWFFIFGLLTWGLASSFFPEFLVGQTVTTYWVLGAVSAVCLFVSVLLHELSHSLVAMAKGIKVESITLFFFGGVAGITKEDIKPSSEFLMAIAGPLFSLFLSFVFFVIFFYNGNPYVTVISLYLYQLNLILAIFNLVPGYPLDGGRAFRALLYWYYKDLRKATKIAATGGRIFAGILVMLGVFSFFSGGNGLWFIFIGLFLYFIAGVGYQQVVVREALIKVPLKGLIRKNFPTVSSEMKFVDFVKEHIDGEEEAFLVKGKNFLGVLDLKNLTSMPLRRQKVVKLKQVVLSMERARKLQLKSNAYEAYKMMGNRGVDVLPVLNGKKLVGVVTRQALNRRLMMQMRYMETIKK